MVDAIVSFVLDQLLSVAVEEAKERVRLVKGVGNEVKRLQGNFEAILAVLADAEQRQVKEAPVRLWLQKLKDASYDMEDVLDEWNTARLKLQIEGVDEKALFPQSKVCSSFFPAASCFGVKQIFLRHDIAQKIKEMNANLDDIARQKDLFNLSATRGSEQKFEKMQSTSLINVSEVCGRDKEKNTLKSKLLCESCEEQTAVQIISLVGMGGIGKTTLAQYVFNDIDVINNFEKRIWVCVSDPFDEIRVAKAIIEALEGSATNLNELNSLILRIDATLAGKKFFLVLDDVWTEDYSKWESLQHCLMNGLHGSKILVTTRKETVALMMESTDLISVVKLSEEECWALFKRLAFSGRPPSACKELEVIGRKIVGKCKGLPLAAKSIGSLLRFKSSKEEWQNILDSEMWQLEELEAGLLAPLLLSYDDLPAPIKCCFSYCAVFPKDYDFEKDELIRLWMAQGYVRPKGIKELEMIGEEYFQCLASRSFFHEFELDDLGRITDCKMHDIVHDFAKYLTANECFSMEFDGSVETSSLIDTCQKKLRHSMLILDGDSNTSCFLSKFNATSLRTLLIDGNSRVTSQMLQGLLDQVKCLRALKIYDLKDDEGVEKGEITNGIEKLEHLRFLKLSKLDIEEIPETCCELFNLQTLEVGGPMRKLPQGMEKLVNLRHLIFTGGMFRLDYMPKGIERLTSLRTLSDFVVSPIGGKFAGKACKLEGLRHMNRLRGTLRIRNLGNVTNVDEARLVDLEKKKNLLGLEFWFDKEEKTDENEANDEAITEVIQLPPNLEYFGIFYYTGKSLTFSNWVTSFNKLRKLCFEDCMNCESLPSLGHLPSLEVLMISFVAGVRKVGDEILGTENDLHGTSLSSSSASAVIAFPELKHLTILNMVQFEEWHFERQDIRIMPQLKSMRISSCPKLKSLPDQLLQSTSLERLTIVKCPALQEHFDKDTGKDWSKISHIPDTIISNDRIDFHIEIAALRFIAAAK